MGVKISVSFTDNHGQIAGARSFPGNTRDGRTSRSTPAGNGCTAGPTGHPESSIATAYLVYRGVNPEVESQSDSRTECLEPFGIRQAIAVARSVARNNAQFFATSPLPVLSINNFVAY